MILSPQRVARAFLIPFALAALAGNTAVAGTCKDELRGRELQQINEKKTEYFIRFGNGDWIRCNSSGFNEETCNGRRVGGYKAFINWITDNNGNELRLGNPNTYDESATCSVSGDVAIEKEVELATYNLPGGKTVSKKEVKTRRYKMFNYSF
jgi:hypothetical protein